MVLRKHEALQSMSGNNVKLYLSYKVLKMETPSKKP